LGVLFSRKGISTTEFDGAQPLIMKKNTLVRYVHSLLFIPLVTTMFATPGPVKQTAPTGFANSFVTSLQINNSIAMADITEAVVDTRAERIDEYFASRGLPLAGHGKTFVEAADENDLDWRLVAAIAMRETTGGKFMCKNPKAPNNPFGWGSCKFGFESVDTAIVKVTTHLAGNHPNTDHYYEGKDVKAILQTYNPPSIVEKYADQVMKIMEDIENTSIDVATS
jgi:hypothetical protein